MAELCRKYGISDATFLQVAFEVRRAGSVGGGAALELGVENAKLKRFLGDAMLDVSTPRSCWEKLLTPRNRRDAVDWAVKERGHSQRRACSRVGIDARVYRYRSSRPDESESRRTLPVLAESRRSGYRPLHLWLAREGVVVTRKKLYRLYKEDRLTVGKRGGRKPALGTRAPMTIPPGTNQRWSVDFRLGRQILTSKQSHLPTMPRYNPGCIVQVGFVP